MVNLKIKKDILWYWWSSHHISSNELRSSSVNEAALQLSYNVNRYWYSFTSIHSWHHYYISCLCSACVQIYIYICHFWGLLFICSSQMFVTYVCHICWSHMFVTYCSSQMFVTDVHCRSSKNKNCSKVVMNMNSCIGHLTNWATDDLILCSPIIYHYIAILSICVCVTIFVTHVCCTFYLSNKSRINSKVVTNISLQIRHLTNWATAHAIWWS